MNRNKIKILAVGIAKYASLNARTKGDNADYLSYQIPIIRRLLSSRYSALKMPRQTGKTWTASFIAVAYLLCGIDVLIAYPTFKQGQKLLLSKIVHICEMLGIGLPTNNMYGIECSNGAAVHVVTTNDIAKSNRGLSVGLLIIDEAQDVSAKALDILAPSTNKYKRMDLDTIIVTGTGGARGRLLETSWRERTYQLVHLLPEDIIKVDPGYKSINDADKKTLSPQGYKAEVLCEVLEGGNSCIIKNINNPLPDSCKNSYHHNIVGIDIGENPDNTVAMWCKYYPGTIARLEVFKTLQLGVFYDEQLPILRQWILDNNLEQCPIAVETNGVGRPIYRFLNKKYKDDERPLTKVGSFFITRQDKIDLVYRLQGFDYNNALHITDKNSYNALNGLCAFRNDNGVVKFDHSDYLSALLAAITRIGI